MRGLRRVRKGDRGLSADDLNFVFDQAERFNRLMVTGGTLSQGHSGTTLHIPSAEDFGLVLGKASESDSGYPSFDNDRKVFPVQLLSNPSYDPADPTAELTYSLLQTPETYVYNLAHCWIFEDTWLPMWRCNGQLYTWNNQKRTGVATADIAKGATGSVSVLGITITARALYGPTVNGQSLSVYHDGTEWVIDAEECP